MAVNLIHLHLLFLDQDVHSDFQRCHGSVEVGAHEVGQGETALRRAKNHGAALGHVHQVFTGQIAVGQQASAVVLSLQGLGVEGGIELVRVHLHAQPGGELPE